MGRNSKPRERLLDGGKEVTYAKPPAPIQRIPGQARAFRDYRIFCDDPYITIDSYKRQALFIIFSIDRTKPLLQLTLEAKEQIKSFLEIAIADSSTPRTPWRHFWAFVSLHEGFLKVPKDAGDYYLSKLLEILLEPNSYDIRPEAEEIYRRHFNLE